MSWAELITIGHEARQMRREDREKPIIECPECGQPLDVKGDVVNCPWGHFRQLGRMRGASSL